MVERGAEGLMLHDRDKPRDFDSLGYSALMYGDPPCGWKELAEAAKEIHRAQARACLIAALAE
jgi:hypothetical protein